jgi:Ca2+-binding EF-hand superfamily protein
MKKLVVIPMVLGLAACGDDSIDTLLDDAASSAALSQGEGEALEGVPGDNVADGAVEETAGEELMENSLLANDCSFEAMRQNVIDSYDENGDGKLDETERAALREELGDQPRRRRVRWARHHRLARLRWIYDVDGSGDLDEAERAERRADLEARCEARLAYLLENFDADGDGELNEEEWAAVHQALVERVRERRQSVFAEFDGNGDGELDRAELMAFHGYLRSRFQERRRAVLAEYDENGDGVLDETEKEALREYLRARIRGEYFGSEGRF